MMHGRVALVWAACLVALAVGCKDCTGREEPAAEAAEDVEDTIGAEDGDTIAEVDWLVPVFLVVSPMDERFFSTVAFDPVWALREAKRQRCNGVLIASNLVLTAAHCVCAPSHGEPSRFDGSGCAAKVTVGIDYGDPSVDDGGRTEWKDEIAGDIVVHPRFQLTLDSQGGVATSRADLAVIRLERPVSPKIEPARLAAEGVEVGEHLDVVGLGDGTGQIGRGLGRARVQTPAGEDRVRFRFQHEDDYMGEPGSPWVRETKLGDFDLVGISQCGLGLTPTFTPVAPYREWLEEQIRVASGKP